MALAWGLAVWPYSPAAACAGVVLLLAGYAPMLGLQMLVASWVQRQEPGPQPRWNELALAWWQEVDVALRVCGWRQPFVWRRWPDAVPVPGAASDVAPVVFIHGIVCNRGFWHPWMQALRRLGVPYVSVNLEPVFGPIENYVPLIEAAVRRAEALGTQAPRLVCHSMGGLVARAWLAAAADHPDRVQQVLTIASPHHGTWLARFSHLPNARQMRLHSAWLQALAAREARLRPDATYRQFICWYSPADNIVYPASTATLPGADNRRVAAAAHVALAFHPRVMRESLAVLASGASSPCEATSA